MPVATGTTVGDLADRVFSDWLFSGEDQPIIVTLAADVDDSTGTWTYDDDTLAPDEEEALSPGVIVEAGSEQARVKSVDYDANSITVIRGVNGTTAAAHSEGDEVVVAPTYGRRAVVDAVLENVEALYPSLWHVDTEEITTSTTFVEVPSEVVTPLSLLWACGDDYIDAPLPQLLPNFPPSSTGKAIRTIGTQDGRTAYFTYRSKFSRPDDEDADVGESGVERQWERIVVVGAAAQVVASRPLDRLTAEYITEQLEREALPPGSPTDIRNGLLTLRDLWLRDAARDLRASEHHPVVYMPTRAVR